MRHSYGHSMHALKSPIVCLIRVRLALLLSPFIKHLSAEEKKRQHMLQRNLGTCDLKNDALLEGFLRIGLQLNKTRNVTVSLLSAWNTWSEICALLTTCPILPLGMGFMEKNKIRWLETQQKEGKKEVTCNQYSRGSPAEGSAVQLVKLQDGELYN